MTLSTHVLTASHRPDRKLPSAFPRVRGVWGPPRPPLSRSSPALPSLASPWVRCRLQPGPAGVRSGPRLLGPPGRAGPLRGFLPPQVLRPLSLAALFRGSIQSWPGSQRQRSSVSRGPAASPCIPAASVMAVTSRGPLPDVPHVLYGTRVLRGVPFIPVTPPVCVRVRDRVCTRVRAWACELACRGLCEAPGCVQVAQGDL